MFELHFKLSFNEFFYHIPLKNFKRAIYSISLFTEKFDNRGEVTIGRNQSADFDLAFFAWEGIFFFETQNDEWGSLRALKLNRRLNKRHFPIWNELQTTNWKEAESSFT